MLFSCLSQICFLLFKVVSFNSRLLYRCKVSLGL